MIQNLTDIAARPPENAYFQKDRETLEKRLGCWLKELACHIRTVGFDLEAWIPAWGPGAKGVRFTGEIERHSLPLASSPLL